MVLAGGAVGFTLSGLYLTLRGVGITWGLNHAPETQTNFNPPRIMKEQDNLTTRRDFLKTSGTAALGGALASDLAFPAVVSAAPNSDKLRIGFIGCGGRGTGAANQALSADSNVVLHAMADVFPDALEKSLTTLQKQM